MNTTSAGEGAKWFLSFFGLIAGVLCAVASAMSFADDGTALGIVFAVLCVACLALSYYLRASLSGGPFGRMTSRRGFGRR